MPLLKKLWNKSKINFIIFYTIVFTFILIDCIFSRIVYRFFGIFPLFLIFLIFQIVIGSYLYYNVLLTKNEKQDKEKIMPIICSCFSNLKCGKTKHPLIDEYDLGQFFHFLSSEYQVSDCFWGEYNKTRFIAEEYWAGGVTIIITIYMNKIFKGDTVINPNSIINLTPLYGLHRTVLEDVEFEKKIQCLHK